MYSKTILLILTLFFSSMVIGQEDYNYEDESNDYSKVRLLDINFNISKPSRQYAQKLEETGIGVHAALLAQFRPDSPFFWGLGGGWKNYYSVDDVIIDGGDEIRRKTSLANGDLHLLFRVFPKLNIPIIEPYIEGSLGGTFLYTFTSLSFADTGESLDFDFDETDWAVNYGASVGTIVNLKDYIYYLNLKVGYMLGTSAEYEIREDANAAIPGSLTLEQSATDILHFHIGLTIAL